jgi:hypothetical protein
MDTSKYYKSDFQARRTLSGSWWTPTIKSETKYKYFYPDFVHFRPRHCGNDYLPGQIIGMVSVQVQNFPISRNEYVVMFYDKDDTENNFMGYFVKEEDLGPISEVIDDSQNPKYKKAMFRLKRSNSGNSPAYDFSKTKKIDIYGEIELLINKSEI